MTHDHDTFYGIFEKGQKLKEALLKLDLNQIYSARTLNVIISMLFKVTLWI